MNGRVDSPIYLAAAGTRIVLPELPVDRPRNVLALRHVLLEANRTRAVDPAYLLGVDRVEVRPLLCGEVLAEFAPDPDPSGVGVIRLEHLGDGKVGARCQVNLNGHAFERAVLVPHPF